MANGCGSSYSFVGLISGRWTLRLLAELTDGARRYQDLHHVLEGVSHKVLTDTLRSAERDGLVHRRLDLERTGTATLYELSELGKSLEGPLVVVERWVEANWPLVEAARRNWSARTES